MGAESALDRPVPEPRLLELDRADVATPPDLAWAAARDADLGRSPLVHALFAIRTLPARLVGRESESPRLRIDDIGSAERTGFRILAESEREVVLGAIGKVWKLDIPFANVQSAEDFVAFAEPNFVMDRQMLRGVKERAER